MLTKDSLPEHGTGSGLLPYLKVTMVYSDRPSSKLATEVCDSLREKLGPEFHLEESSWKLELLRNDKLRNFAAEEALQSDIIIVASPEAGSVPEEFESWFQLWKDHRQSNPAALIALIDGRNTTNHSADVLQGWLARKASEARMEFFCHVEMNQPLQLNEAFEDLDAPVVLHSDIKTMDLQPKRFSI